MSVPFTSHTTANNFIVNYLKNHMRSQLPKTVSGGLYYYQSPQNTQLQLQSTQQVLTQYNTSNQRQQHGQQNHVYTHNISHDINHDQSAVNVISKEEMEQRWRVKCEALQDSLTHCQTELLRLRGMGAKEKVTYVEDTIKLNQLYYEIERLNKVLIDTTFELENYKSKCKKLEEKTPQEVDIDQLRRIMEENENILHDEINTYKNQLDEWQKRYRILELSLNEVRGSGDGVVRDQDIKMSEIRQELERVTYAYQDKEDECEEVKGRLRTLENQLKDQASTDVEIRRLKEMIATRNSEIEDLRYQQMNNQEMEAKMGNLYNEIDRLNGLLKLKQNEINMMHTEVKQLQKALGDTSEYVELQYRYKKLQDENESLQMQLKYQITPLYTHHQQGTRLPVPLQRTQLLLHRERVQVQRLGAALHRPRKGKHGITQRARVHRGVQDEIG